MPASFPLVQVGYYPVSLESRNIGQVDNTNATPVSDRRIAAVGRVVGMPAGAIYTEFLEESFTGFHVFFSQFVSRLAIG